MIRGGLPYGSGGRRKLQIIRVDNGPEYISGKLMAWAAKRDNRTVWHE